MPRAFTTRSAAVALAAGGVLVVIFAGLLGHFQRDLAAEIHRKIIGRDAAVLHPVALQQLREAAAQHPGALVPAAERHTGADDSMSPNNDSVLAVLAALKSAQQTGMLGVAVFDADGNPLRAVPASMLFVDLAPDVYLELTLLTPISRYHPRFALGPAFAGIQPGDEPAPVLEVLLPLYYPGAKQLAGVAQYFIDARGLAQELAVVDDRIAAQMRITLLLGATLILLVVAAASWGLERAQRVIAERNERLIRANLELALAAKASVLGQITSHLLHGLQGPVAGLRAVLSARGTHESAEDWQSASDYTARLQAMIQETVAMLSERSAANTYELSGDDLVAALRERHQPAARGHNVTLAFAGGFTVCLDSNRGHLLSLIAGNLIENALQASPAGATMRVALALVDGEVELTVTDAGAGVPAEILDRLFQPGRSGKPGGTGLGLAISQLLALEIGATLQLVRSGPTGTEFSVKMPLRPAV
ncbi:MAG TPA: sensor histidine kinase [Lacunisphaera sp.]|nr:sensor histidine kinase [Lacunisphaera sp.]